MNNYTDLITRLRQYSVPYNLRETAAASIEDLLALLREEACQCGQKHMIDSEDHFVHCRYRQLVEPAPNRTKLDLMEEYLARVTYLHEEDGKKLLRLARVAVEGFRIRSRENLTYSTKESIEQHTREREALRDIDPRLVEDE